MLSFDVSVIIPTHNRISMLEKALASVYAQEFDDVIEIIVVDDNSQDGTSKIVSREYPDVHLISLKQNVGAYAARNRALKEAKGKYIAFLDSDDLWETNYLKTQITALEGRGRCFCVSAVFLWYTLRDEKELRLQKPDLEKYSSPFHQLLVELSFIATPSSVVFPRQVFTEVGLFNELDRICGDADFYIRCLLNGYQPIYTEIPAVLWRKHDNGQATSPENQKKRKKIKNRQITKYHHLIAECVDIAPIHLIRAEFHSRYASQYFRGKKILPWLSSSLLSAYNAPRYALFNMWHDVSYVLQRKVRKFAWFS